MMAGKTLYELLWDYDPNGLVVVDTQGNVTLVNPSFARMFKIDAQNIVGYPVSRILDDADDFRRVWDSGQPLVGEGREYPHYHVFVRKVMFPIPAENVVACIMVDLTHEWQQQNDIVKLRRETIEEVNRVVDRQMKVAQEIAGLLGETTAETKISLLRLVKMVEQEIL